jgi:restriction system protein
VRPGELEEREMAIPDYQTVMLPLLEMMGDTQEHSLRETIDALAVEFGLTEVEKKELLPSGKQAVFDNRVGWARTYLKKAGLLTTTRRAYFRITARGQELLREHPSMVNVSMLLRYPEFREFRALRKAGVGGAKPAVEDEQTPKELLEAAYENLNDSLESDLLQQLGEVSPRRFEHIVLDLLVAMGYGGSQRDAAAAIGRSGDEGIDGVINEDRLGLERVYVQAKRWQHSVGSGEIQGFVGALELKHAAKGVFITTSNYTSQAVQLADSAAKRVILIDGRRLAQLMVEFSVGCSTVDRYEVKKLDTDYFTEESQGWG